METAIKPSATDQFGSLLEQLVSEQLTTRRLKGIVERALAEQQPRVLQVIGPSTDVKLNEHRHPMFEKVLRLASAGVNVLLVGPAGSGKTHIAAQVARALDRPFSSISLTAGASESQLIGRLLPTGDDGRFEYQESPFVRLYENGGVFLFDEMDAADPNMLLIVNTALANGGFTCELRTNNESVVRHADSVMIGAANTFGTGADTLYSGRSQLDAATLDRWYPVMIDYDKSYEASLAGAAAPASTVWAPAEPAADSEIAALADWTWALRNRATEAKLRRVISTRTLQKAIAAARAGVPIHEVKQDVVAGWSRDEKAKMGGILA